MAGVLDHDLRRRLERALGHEERVPRTEPFFNGDCQSAVTAPDGDLARRIRPAQPLASVLLCVTPRSRAFWTIRSTCATASSQRVVTPSASEEHRQAASEEGDL